MPSRLTVRGSINVRPDSSENGTLADLKYDDTGSGSTHEYVRDYPAYQLATTGTPGAVFRLLDSPTIVEKLFIHSLSKQDVAVRLNGAAATLIGSAAAFGTLVNGDSFTINTDQGGVIVVTFETGDITGAKAAARINALVGAIVATIDATSGQLRLTGTKTGGQDAFAKSFQYGSIVLGAGAALAKLGLAVGTTYGAGDDRVISGRLLEEPSTTRTVSKIELSGSASLNMVVAGRSS